MIFLTIAICTYNSRGHLKRALTSIVEQRLPNYEFELLVIDNNSNESHDFIKTDKIFQNIRYFSEPRQGLSFARNRAIKEAKGVWIAFIDDDAELCQNYLYEFYITINKFHDVVALGGKVLPKWETITSQFWNYPIFQNVFSLVNWGDEIKYLSKEEWLVGTNMVFKRDFLIEIGGFNDRLGRKGSNLLSNEEISLQNTIKKKQLNLLYVPQMLVYHWVSNDRTKLKWIMKRYFWQGISDSISFNRKKIFIILSIIKYFLKLNVSIINREHFINNFFMICYQIGFLVGSGKKHG